MKWLKFYRERVPDLEEPSAGTTNTVAKCVLHPNPDGKSLSIDLESGKFKCHVAHCVGHKGGAWKKFERLLKGETFVGEGVTATHEIDKALVDAHHKVLLQSARSLEFMRKKRGYTDETIARFRLGYDGERYWIPIADESGKFVNVRKYLPGAPEDKMIGYTAGQNVARLFPIDNLVSNWILLCEGETDTMLACQYGFPAITVTGGADTWRREFTEQLRGKLVVICYDADEAGRRGAAQHAISLLEAASEVRILKLPLRGTKAEKDLSNYLLNLGHSADDLRALIDAAEVIENKLGAGDNAPPPDEVSEIHLSEIGEDHLVGKRVRSTVLVAGKDLAPFQVPFKIGFQCEMGEKQCAGCGIARAGGQKEVQVPEYSSTLLEMVNVPSSTLEFVLARLAGVPAKCWKFKREIKEYANVESIKAIPEIDFTSERSEYVIRNLYYLGHGMETNHTYKIESVVMPDPKNQYATSLVYKAEPSQDSVEKFELDPETVEMLSIFKVK